MPKGVWVWPADLQSQQETLKNVAISPHLRAAMTALASSKEGMSNAELDDAIGGSSEWTTLWIARQLTALGFVEFKVDFFGNPARYHLTELGRTAFSKMTGTPLPASPPASSPQQAAVPKSA
ncbi:MAG: hypothetical protein JRM77_09925 [Nitrososphaerota archaeon]|nr:hypothetical protein [Nitrososphaerota archaeon]